jgi:hypothetical protein
MLSPIALDEACFKANSLKMLIEIRFIYLNSFSIIKPCRIEFI